MPQQTTAKEYAAKLGISISSARARLEKMVEAGTATKRTDNEMVYRRHRGYSGSYMPVRVTTYTIS
jgi:predicted ArsR family transcriptional regulator